MRPAERIRWARNEWSLVGVSDKQRDLHFAEQHVAIKIPGMVISSAISYASSSVALNAHTSYPRKSLLRCEARIQDMLDSHRSLHIAQQKHGKFLNLSSITNVKVLSGHFIY